MRRRESGREHFEEQEARVTEIQQNLLFAVSAIILVGTMAVFIWQYFRGRGRGD